MKKTYVFRYDTKDGKFIGYHYDSFCSTGNSVIEAKRYPMSEETIQAQTETIRHNWNYLCDKYTHGKFHGYPKEDVVITCEELSEQIEEKYPHVTKWARVENDNQGGVNIIPIKQLS